MAAAVKPGPRQKAKALNFAKNRQGRESDPNSTKGAAEKVSNLASPQAAAAMAVAKKLGLGDTLKLNNKGMRVVWRILLWTLPLSVPIILMFLLIMILMVLLV